MVGEPVDVSSGVPRPYGVDGNLARGASPCTAPYTYFTLNGQTATAVLYDYCYTGGYHRFELLVTTNNSSSYITYVDNTHYYGWGYWALRTWICGGNESIWASNYFPSGRATSFYMITPYLHYNGCGPQADDAWDYVGDNGGRGVYVPYIGF
jgi:hypothetical protein